LFSSAFGFCYQDCAKITLSIFTKRWKGGTEEAIGFRDNPDHALRYG